jgi:hypothetical protein
VAGGDDNTRPLRQGICTYVPTYMKVFFAFLEIIQVICATKIHKMYMNRKLSFKKTYLCTAAPENFFENKHFLD